MNAPILPPPPIEALAWHPNATRIPVRRTMPCTYRGKPATRVLEGEQLCVTCDGVHYVEFPRRKGERPLSEAPAADVVMSDSAMLPAHVERLREMERRAGFRFYPGQFTYLVDVAQSDGALLAAEVGCGKSALAIGLIEVHRPRRCLVIAPQGVISPARRKQDDEWIYDASQWQREFAKFAPWLAPWSVVPPKGRRMEPPVCDGVLLTYMQDALLNGGGWLKDVPPDLFDMIVVDEAHLLMNPDTLMGRALYRMQPRWRYALTATPIPNRTSECLRLIRWLRPDVPIDVRATRETIVQDGKRIRVANPVEPASPVLFGASLRHAVAAIRKRDIRPDMPPLHVHKVYVDAEPELRARYDATAKDFTLPRGDAGAIERARLTKLRNLCAESVSKAVTMAHLVRMNPGVVVSARTAQTDHVARLLRTSAPHLRQGRIDSTVDAKLHGATSASFQRGWLDVLLMGIKCAYGHSFPGCDTLHVASLEWAFGAFDQACGRVYRVNSQRPVHVYVYLLRGTVEERMFDNVCRQQSVVHRILFGDATGTAASLPPPERLACVL